METLNAILQTYLLGTLTQQSTPDLEAAQLKVALYHDWALAHPDKRSDAIPTPETLKPVFDLITTTLYNRSVGLDGMTHITALTHG